MSKDTEIVRTIQVEDEIRRLLLPHVAQAFAGELQRQTVMSRLSYAASTTEFSESVMKLRDET